MGTTNYTNRVAGLLRNMRANAERNREALESVATAQRAFRFLAGILDNVTRAALDSAINGAVALLRAGDNAGASAYADAILSSLGAAFWDYGPDATPGAAAVTRFADDILLSAGRHLTHGTAAYRHARTLAVALRDRHGPAALASHVRTFGAAAIGTTPPTYHRAIVRAINGALAGLGAGPA